ncbi:Ig-like domain-containing protein [Paenibacillus sp. SI8]|uniref:Ig-like domain-containing protein n=1 Tax=unclassified Paenibacillus TaxID=185978 RepID=UPI00346566DD
MKIRRFIQTSLLTAFLLLGQWSGGNPVGATQLDTVNLLQDPGFEAADPSPWVISGTSSAVSIQAKDNHTQGGPHSVAYWSDSSFQFSVSQRIEGLADGRYVLTAWSQGGGGEKVSRLFAKDYGGEQLYADFTNTGYDLWSQPKISHIQINVINGTCTVGVEVEGNPNNWGSLDDVAFTRIGDLDSSSAAVTIDPVQVNTFIHTPPDLPSVVRSVYEDDRSYKNVPVVWAPLNEAVYARPGTFQVMGTLMGTDARAIANITVEMKSADLNGDQQVNVADVAFAVYYLGSTPSADGWEAAKTADLNNDGLIDIIDLQLITDQLVGNPI